MKWLVCVTLVGCASLPRNGLPLNDERTRALTVLDRQFARAKLPSPIAFSRILWLNSDVIALDEERPACGVAEVEMDERQPMFPRCLVLVAASGKYISQTSFSHELMHCALAARYGDVDADHVRIEWGFVERFNDTLAKDGL